MDSVWERFGSVDISGDAGGTIGAALPDANYKGRRGQRAGGNCALRETAVPFDYVIGKMLLELGGGNHRLFWVEQELRRTFPRIGCHTHANKGIKADSEHSVCMMYSCAASG